MALLNESGLVLLRIAVRLIAHRLHIILPAPEDAQRNSDATVFPAITPRVCLQLSDCVFVIGLLFLLIVVVARDGGGGFGDFSVNCTTAAARSPKIKRKLYSGEREHHQMILF